MQIALVSGAYPRREVVARGISAKLGGIHVEVFSCCEDVLESSLDYQVLEASSGVETADRSTAR